MVQSKFSLTKAQIEFINRHEALGFADRSAVVREALDQLRARLAQQRIVESAELYAEIYSEDEDLRKLTDSAREGWPG